MSVTFKTVKTCFYCQEVTPTLGKGWPLRFGGFAQLCDDCCSAYENGTFCQIFHVDVDGWRECAMCGTMVHCGCIMAAHTFTELDAGGVSCKNCFKKKETIVAKQGSFSGGSSAPGPGTDVVGPSGADTKAGMTGPAAKNF